MPRMRGLTLIVTTADAERWGAALTLAAASAALGARTRLYLHEGAVALLAAPEPRLALAIESGAAVIACQTGLIDAGLSADALPDGVETGGMVALLAGLDDDRLTTI